MALLHCNFFSSSLDVACSMDVIVPQKPLSAGAKVRPEYPVLYLLHGLSDDHTTWQRRTSIERYAADMDLVIVMPAVQRSFYADMKSGHKYWTFISEELPAICRGMFPISSRREDTFVAGLSMGGYGAFKLALTHPDRYAAAASLSGVMDVARRVKREKSWQPELKLIFGNLNRLSGTPNDLFHLAKQMKARRGPQPRLLQICGTEDFLYDDNRRFMEYALALKLDHCYEEGPGGHGWDYWDTTIQRVLNWLPLAGKTRP